MQARRLVSARFSETQQFIDDADLTQMQQTVSGELGNIGRSEACAKALHLEKHSVSAIPAARKEAPGDSKGVSRSVLQTEETK